MAEKIEIWDPHFHIWDVGDNTESGHELEQLLAVNGEEMETPHLDVHYRAPRRSTFWYD